MKRTTTAFAVLAVLGISYSASAHEMSKHMPGAHDTAKQVAITMVGEIVDAGCYLGHAARGADHADCAKQCISGGMPMCLLTGQGTLYLLTMNHDNPDPYNKLKGMAGKTVSVTGDVMARSGMKGIDVAGFKPMAL
ncbi:MAG TPA: hypothetical protein VER38_06845 [Candidatus Eisenbacteria bacterium]|nr:hypothetical protein [Candidatus Eisenbacteria bacterium]